MKLGALKTIKIEKLNGHLLGSFLIANDIYGMVEDYVCFEIRYMVWWDCAGFIAGFFRAELLV